MSLTVERKLTTILAADAEGYSRIMVADEEGGLASLRTARRVFSKFIELHRGRIANTAGDGLIAEFPSVVEAVRCAVDVQHELHAGEGQSGNPMRFRIGIHLGDVMVDGQDLLGEGVNLAARLQSMAEPGGILISRQVYDQVRGKLELAIDYLGERRPKNFAEDIPVYRLTLDRRERPPEHNPFGGHANRHAKPHEQPGKSSHPAAADGRTERARRRAWQYAILIGALAVIDLATGGPFWFQWPALGMSVAWGLEAAPLVSRGWLSALYIRYVVVVSGLVCVNILTWTGDPWVLYPALALIVVEALRRAGGKRRHD